MNRYYNIKNDEVIFYPYNNAFLRFISIIGILVMSILFVWLVADVRDYIALLVIGVPVLVGLAMFAWFYVLTKTGIVFDKKKKKVYKQRLGIVTFIADFQDIDSIRFFTELGIKSEGQYRLFLQSDTQGLGIALSPSLDMDSEKFSLFTKEVIDPLLLCIGNDEAPVLDVPKIESEKLFKIIDLGVYEVEYKSSTFLMIWFSLILLLPIILIVIGAFNINTTKTFVIVYGLSLLVYLFFYLIGLFKSKLKIDINNQIITRFHLFNLIKSEDSYKEILNLGTKRSYQRERYSERASSFIGVSIYLTIVDSDDNEKEIKLIDNISDTKKATRLVNEIKAIFKV
jgi:hypothetical protein